MAIRDRISGLFKRGKKTDDLDAPVGERHLLPARATEEERNEVLRQLADGFTSIGSSLEHLNEHLQASTRNLEGMVQTQNRLPGLLEEQRSLIEKTNGVAEGQQQMLDAYLKQLAERDTVQAQLVDSLGEVSSGLQQLRDHDRHQLDLLLQFQRSGRRMTMAIGLLGLLVITALLALLLVVALRPDLLGLERQPPLSSQRVAPPPAQPAPSAPTTEPPPALTQRPVQGQTPTTDDIP